MTGEVERPHLDHGSKDIQLWNYWAKSAEAGSYHALPPHLLDVAAVGMAHLRAHPGLCVAWAEALALRPDELERFLGWFLAVHDIGKFCDRFQGCHPALFASLWPGRARRDYQPHHTTLGSIVLQERVFPALAARLAEGHPWPARHWARVLGAAEPAFTGHHGEPPEARVPRPDDWDSEGARAALAWADGVARLLPLDGLWVDGPPARDVAARLRAASWHLAGFAVQCDWIGSNTRWFQPTSRQVNAQEYWQDALARASVAVAEVGIVPVEAAPPLTMAGSFQRDATPLQRAVEAWAPGEGPHLVIVEETTGSGKTEASLLAASRIMAARGAEGFYFALPTQATANAMYDRVRTAAHAMFKRPEAASLVLAHSGKLAMRSFREEAWSGSAAPAEGAMSEQGRLQCAAWLADSRKKAFLAQAGVGTLDQALLGVLPVRHQSLRLYGLTSKVLVVDEVHAYDPYATRLLESLVRFHTRAGGSTVLLSATMPLALRRRLAAAFAEAADLQAPALDATDYPLLTLVGQAGAFEIPLPARAACARSVAVEFVHDAAAVIEVVRRAAAAGQAVCWIRNTVKDAVAGWRALADEGASLFHARFTETDRGRIEADVRKWAGPDSKPADRRGRVLVATQVVEQSLDVDFDVLVTDLAPVDLLIQRAGRLHRHAHRERPVDGGPVLHVHAPEWRDEPGEDWVRSWSSGTAAVYEDHGRLWLTQQVLREQGRLRVPEDARFLIERVYGTGAAARVPAALGTATRRAEEGGLANQSHAAARTLALEEGYAARDGKWGDPDRARTRAGEPTVDLHLATREGGRLVPLAAPEDGWEGARVRVREKDAARAGLLDGEPPGAIPPGVRHVLTLERESADTWTARPAGMIITYDPRAGLTIEEEA